MNNDTTNNIANIVLRVSELCDIAPHDLISKSKNRKASEARYIVYTYLHYEAKMSSTTIGKYFGRSRVSILRSIRILKGWIDFHAETKVKYESIVEKLKGGL